MADSSHIVSVYYDGQQKTITTNANTVGAVLDQVGVKLSGDDLVEPGVNTSIPEGFYNINVYRSRPVEVVDGAKSYVVHTALQSPHLIAQAAGLTVYPEDTYDVSVINDVTQTDLVGQRVVIHRSVPLTLVADGATTTVRTQQKTVGGMLDERDVALGPQDSVQPGAATPITAGMTVQINRVKVVEQTVTEAIAKPVQNVNDDSLEIGTTQVQTPGSDGSKQTVYRVHYQNGVEQSREQLSQTILLQPVTEVVHVGTHIDLSADPVKLGQEMATARGWTGSEWDGLYQLWEHESGWNPNSRNIWSGACGIPQASPCSKITDMSAAGQITWGLNYIAGKYGNPANAWAYWQSHHSY